MTELAFKDFYDLSKPRQDPDTSPRVKQIYQAQFPALYRAVTNGEIRTLDGKSLELGGDTLITYRCAIKKLFGMYFDQMELSAKNVIVTALNAVSNTTKKQIACWDGRCVINNHQIGNMMPFPRGVPSLNSIRAVGIYDYFDRFLAEVECYYAAAGNYQPKSPLQEAIKYYHSYFDFFGSYSRFIEENLLQDFVGVDLWSIDDFGEYVRVANTIIDRRGMRFAASTRSLA